MPRPIFARPFWKDFWEDLDQQRSRYKNSQAISLFSDSGSSAISLVFRLA